MAGYIDLRFLHSSHTATTTSFPLLQILNPSIEATMGLPRGTFDAVAAPAASLIDAGDHGEESLHAAGSLSSSGSDARTQTA